MPQQPHAAECVKRDDVRDAKHLLQPACDEARLEEVRMANRIRRAAIARGFRVIDDDARERRHVRQQRFLAHERCRAGTHVHDAYAGHPLDDVGKRAATHAH